MYDFAITTAANTSKANPTRTALRLRTGVVTLVHVAFPPGAQGLHHLIIQRGGSLLWPENEGEGFAWDDFTVIFSPFTELTLGNSSLTAVTWNIDDTFSHQVNVRLEVLRRELVFPDRTELTLLQELRARLFGGRK